MTKESVKPKKIKLSLAQMEVVERLKKVGTIKVGGSITISQIRAMERLGITQYNNSYTGIVLTDFGKNYTQ